MNNELKYRLGTGNYGGKLTFLIETKEKGWFGTTTWKKYKEYYALDSMMSFMDMHEEDLKSKGYTKETE